MALLTSATFLWSSLLAAPAGVWAQVPHKPSFGKPKPLPAPVVHDDPAWHTIDYHARERAPASVLNQPVARSGKTPSAPLRLRTLTLLDEAGRLASPIEAKRVAEWKRQLHRPKTRSDAENARLHLWLGEYTLTHEEQPEQALWHFALAQKLSRRTEAVHGLAAYDRAIALYYEGAYSQAQAAFKHILTSRPGLRGFDSRTCSLFMRHAGACAGYHEERAKLGIPEPPRLDPLCGASAVAQALKSAGKAYDKKTVLAHLHVTGRGSSIVDVVEGARKLGMSAGIVSADEAGLIALPKPLVAYVEHDHFVSVVHADTQGVAYLCADCGPWPGGRVNLTWAQWRRMEATHYVTVQKPASEAAQALSLLQDRQNGKAAGVQVASTQPASALRGMAPVTALLRRLDRHVRVLCGQGGDWDNAPRFSLTCGFTPVSQQCNCSVCCPFDFLPAMPFGAAFGDPVNLATGEEEYTPAPDLTVYNPLGPSVTWQRVYNSLRGGQTGYEFSDLGAGWSHTYNMGVLTYGASGGGGGDEARLARDRGRTCGQRTNGIGGGSGVPSSIYLIAPNGARIQITVAALPSAANPHIACTVQAGVPMLAEWDYDSATGNNYFTITQADRTRWITQAGVPASSLGGAQPSGTWYPLHQIVDRNSNAITLNYGASVGGYPLLASIVDKNGSALLTFNRVANGTGNLTSVADRYGRSVYYNVSAYATQNVPQTVNQPSQPELDHVSQVVLTGTAAPPDRYVYGYQNVANGEGSETIPMLHTLAVPSPMGTGTATATINYESNTAGVSSVVDANGNSRSYRQTDGSHTQVTVRDAQGNVVYRYTAGYDMNMSKTTVTNGLVNGNGANTQIIRSKTYADPNDPYRPSQTMDGNGLAVNGANGKGTWNYTWDQWGHCLTATSPRGTVTTNTYSYANFALGERTQIQTGGKQAATFTYYEPSGLPHTVTAPLPGTTGGNQSVTTSYTYSPLGNLLSVTTPGNGTVASKTTTYGYTQDGAYSQSEALGQPLTVTDNLGKTVHVRYDAQGRAVSGMDALGNATTTSYNLAGQPFQTLLPATGQTGTGQGATQNTYLYAGGPLTQTAVYDESGNLARHVSPIYGKEGESLSATGDVNPVSTAYDGLYRAKTLTDGNNHATTTSYTSAGYAAQSQLANGDTYQATTWDANGNVLSSVDARGTVVNYAYNDVESSLTDIQYPATPALNVHIDYDAYGRAVHVTDSAGGKSVTYDDDNLPTSLTTTYLNAAGTANLPPLGLTYGYNPDGSRSSLTTPAGTFSYGYDGRGLPASVSNPQGESFGWTYLDNGWLWTQTLGNAATTTYAYNALGEVTDLAHRKQSGSTLLAEFGGQSYDAIGNRVSVSASLPSSPAYSGTTSYQYDNRNELTQESSGRAGGYVNGYGYDLVGNATTFKGAAQAFNAVNQNTQGGALGFDGNGNSAGYNGTALSWDANNKLAAVGSVLTAGYGADGLRAWKQTAAGRTYFVYDGLVPVCETDASGNVTAVNTWGSNGLLARRAGGSSTFYAFDMQGSVSVRLNASGSVLSSHCNEAWGVQASSGSGYGGDPYAGYGGQWGYYRDVETGLHLLGHRYYDAASGRFLNRDPIGYAGGVNLYAYCGSSPVRGVDPTGLFQANLPVQVGTVIAEGSEGAEAGGAAIGAGAIALPITIVTVGIVGGYYIGGNIGNHYFGPEVPSPESEEADQPYYPLFPINGHKPKPVNPAQPSLPGLDDDCLPEPEPQPSPGPEQGGGPPWGEDEVDCYHKALSARLHTQDQIDSYIQKCMQSPPKNWKPGKTSNDPKWVK